VSSRKNLLEKSALDFFSVSHIFILERNERNDKREREREGEEKEKGRESRSNRDEEVGTL